MNIKKIIIGAAAGALMLSAGGAVFAELTVTPVATQVMPPVPGDRMGQAMVLQIGEKGNVLLRGTVSATTANTVTVKSWGGDWTVNIIATTQLMPGTGMTVGDFVGVQGMINSSAAWTIDAKLVRDWSVRKQAQENKQEIKMMMARNWEGVVVGDVNADGSFKLKVGEVTYDIKMASGAKVVTKNYGVAASGAIKMGDTVRVYGLASGTTITASVIRDVSLALF
jgi:hypothetical protein